MSAVDAQQVFKSTFEVPINEDYFISADIDRYQSVLGHVFSIVDFSVGADIYKLPCNLNINIGNTVGYNNKIVISNTGIKNDPNKDINKDLKKLSVTPPESGRSDSAAHLMKSHIKETDNQKKF